MSNRKKVQGRGGSGLVNDDATRQAMQLLLAGARAMTEETNSRRDSRVAARRAWCGGQESVPAEVPSWPDGSLGDRFFSAMLLEEPSQAPRLREAAMPDARAIAADPAHWNVATAVLVRAVLLDGVPVDDPAVSNDRR